MRIAFVVSNLTYPPVEGLHQQTILTAQMLQNAVGTVHLFGFVKDPSALDQAALEQETGLRFHTIPISTALPDILLGLANAFIPTLFRPRVHQLVAALTKYDIIHFENVGACGLIRRFIAKRSILDLVDPGTLRWHRFSQSANTVRSRWSATAKRFLHLIIERRIAYPGTWLHVVSPRDAAYLATRYPSVTVLGIPVALPNALEPPPLLTPRGPAYLLVFLDLRQPHLRQSFLWFATKVLTRCNQISELQILVLGRVSEDVELRSSVPNLNVTFVEWVEDYQSVLANALIVITPDLVGTGLKNRVLQSMASGRPVVGTTVAFEGIEAKAGIDAIITDSADHMAQSIDHLLASSGARQTMGAAGRNRIIAQFSTKTVEMQWHEAYKRIAEAERIPFL